MKNIKEAGIFLLSIETVNTEGVKQVKIIKGRNIG